MCEKVLLWFCDCFFKDTPSVFWLDYLRLIAGSSLVLVQDSLSLIAGSSLVLSTRFFEFNRRFPPGILNRFPFPFVLLLPKNWPELLTFSEDWGVGLKINILGQNLENCRQDVGNKIRFFYGCKIGRIVFKLKSKHKTIGTFI